MKNISLWLVGIAIIVTSSFTIFYVVHKNHLKQKSDPVSVTSADHVVSSVGRTTNMDQVKLSEVYKYIIGNDAFSKIERDSAKLMYAKNVTDLTPVGLSEDRHKGFIDSYITLYDLSKNAATPEIRARALLAYAYLYLESCSTDSWLHEAWKSLDSDNFEKIKKESKNKKNEMSARILVEVLTRAKAIIDDKSITISILENKLLIAKLSHSRISEEEYQKILNEVAASLETVRTSQSSLDKSPFGLLSTDRQMFSIYVQLALKKIKTTDIDKEFERQLKNTLSRRNETKIGSYTNENNLRYTYANYLWKVDSVKNLPRIKEVLAPSFSEDNEKNSPGWMYGLKIAESKGSYPYLAELSKKYPELKVFLKRHGWKNV